MGNLQIQRVNFIIVMKNLSRFLDHLYIPQRSPLNPDEATVLVSAPWLISTVTLTAPRPPVLGSRAAGVDTAQLQTLHRDRQASECSKHCLINTARKGFI